MKNFARAILNTMDIRENSYDHKAANKAANKAQTSELLTDYSKFYRKTLREAANEAVEYAGLNKQAVLPIYLLLTCAWNDISDWATVIMKD